MILNDGEALTQAVLARKGIAQLPRYRVTDLQASGELVEVLGGQLAPRGDIWLIWPPAVSGALRLKAFADFLTDVVSRAI